MISQPSAAFYLKSLGLGTRDYWDPNTWVFWTGNEAKMQSFPETLCEDTSEMLEKSRLEKWNQNNFLN